MQKGEEFFFIIRLSIENQFYNCAVNCYGFRYWLAWPRVLGAVSEIRLPSGRKVSETIPGFAEI